MFGRFQVVVGAAKSSPESAKSLSENIKTNHICIKIAKICTKIAKICWEWPDLAKSHQIWLRTRWISSDLSLISLDLYITSIGSGGSSFGEETHHSTHRRWALGVETQNRLLGAFVLAEIGWVGRSSGSWSGLNTPNYIIYIHQFKKKKKNKRIKFLSKLASLEINSLNFSYIYFLSVNFENLANEFHVPYVLNMYIKFHSNWMLFTI